MGKLEVFGEDQVSGLFGVQRGSGRRSKDLVRIRNNCVDVVGGGVLNRIFGRHIVVKFENYKTIPIVVVVVVVVVYKFVVGVDQQYQIDNK